MNDTHWSTSIICGNHLLHPKVTVTEFRTTRYSDGNFTTLAEPPEITITCTACGKSATATDITFETKSYERI